MLSFRPRDEHCGRNQKIKPPELLMAGDVLRGTASCPLTNDFIKIGLLIGRELALRMGIEIRTLAAENADSTACLSCMRGNCTAKDAKDAKERSPANTR
jgi:hypothetical protein